MKLLTTFVVFLTTSFLLLYSPTTASTSTLTPGTWCSALASGSPVIDILGDSISAGDSVTDPNRRWHTLLDYSLHADGATGAQVWVGGAIPGSATADYLPGAKYSNHIEFTVNHPDLIILGWGTNDWAGGVVSPAQFQTQYQLIIDRINVLSPNSTILLVHMPWVYNTALMASRGDQGPYRDAIRAVAQANNVHYLALEWFFPGDDHYAQAMPDRVHLNESGQNTQFTAVRSTILGMCL